jgi:hypothetical protein
VTARQYELLLPWLRAGFEVAIADEPDPLLLRVGLLTEVEGGYAITKQAVFDKGMRFAERGYVGATVLTPLDPPSA